MHKLLTWSILVFALTAAPVQAHDGRVNVVVWDRYFNPTHPSLHVPGNGTIGESLALEPHGTTCLSRKPISVELLDIYGGHNHS